MAKAFDSLDHYQLLLIMQDLGFPPEYVELVRRFLADSTTEIGGEIIPLLRGAPQGSPCSPFLAVLYFEGLARVVQDYVSQNPDGVPEAAQNMGLEPDEYLLIVLLQYADDTTLMGKTRTWLQGLLDAITAWADRCKLTFHAAKSSVTAMTDVSKSDKKQLVVQGAPIPEVPVGKILGVPFAAADGRLTKLVRAEARASIRGGMAKLRQLFTIRKRKGRRADEVLVDFHVLRMAVQQVFLPRVLYAVPVLAVDCSAIDTCLSVQIKALLGLYNRFPPEAVQWLLRLWPTKFAVGEARLKLAWRAYHQYGVKKVIRYLLAHQRSRSYHYLMGKGRGPLGLLTEALEDHGLSWHHLGNAKYAPQPGVPPSKSRGLWKWVKDCRARVKERVATWAVEARQELRRGSALRAHFPSTAEEAMDAIDAGLPPFLAQCGDLGRAGLRLLATRYGSAIAPYEECVLCGLEDSSHPSHLLDCPGLPEQLQTLRRRAVASREKEQRQAARQEGGKAPRLSQEEYSIRQGYIMCWPGMSARTLADHLWWAGHAIDLYCVRRQRALEGPAPQEPRPPVPYLIGLSEAEYGCYRRTSAR